MGPVLRLADPTDKLIQLISSIVRKEKRGGLCRQVGPPNRNVVPPALHEFPVDLLSEQPSHQGQILLIQLLLKVDRVCGDHRPLRIAQRPLRRRNEVSQRLARARTRLHQRDASSVVRLGDPTEHSALPRTVFISGMFLQQGALRADQGLESIDLQWLNDARFRGLDDHE